MKLRSRTPPSPRRHTHSRRAGLPEVQAWQALLARKGLAAVVDAVAVQAQTRFADPHLCHHAYEKTCIYRERSSRSVSTVRPCSLGVSRRPIYICIYIVGVYD